MSKEKNSETMEKRVEECKNKNIHQRINAIMGDITPIVKKEKANTKGLPYDYVTHDDVTRMLRPLFVVHGVDAEFDPIEVKQDGNRTEVSGMMHYINIDNPTDRSSVHAWGYGIDNQDKGYGKAVSYATKISHLKRFMIEAGTAEDIEKYDIDYKPAEKKKEDTNECITELEYERLLSRVDQVKEAKVPFDEFKFKEFFKCPDYSKMDKKTYKDAMLQLNKKMITALPLGA